jgi:hypothetical protein
MRCPELASAAPHSGLCLAEDDPISRTPCGKLGVGEGQFERMDEMIEEEIEKRFSILLTFQHIKSRKVLVP